MSLEVFSIFNQPSCSEYITNRNWASWKKSNEWGLISVVQLGSKEWKRACEMRQGSEFVLPTPGHPLTLPRHLRWPKAWTNVFWEQSGQQQGKHGGGGNRRLDGRPLNVQNWRKGGDRYENDISLASFQTLLRLPMLVISPDLTWRASKTHSLWLFIGILKKNICWPQSSRQLNGKSADC